MAGYYVFTLGDRVSVRPSVVRTCTSVRTSFTFENLHIYRRISFKFKFCKCIVSLGIVNGQILMAHHSVMELGNLQNFFRPRLEYHDQTSQG